MTRKTIPEHSLERLGDVLDAHGPLAADWPEPERAELVALSNNNEDAGRLVREAQALSKLLDEACVPAAVSGALKAHIVDAARSSGDDAGAGEPDHVISFPPAAAPHHLFTPHLPQALLLAASLLIGVWAGASGTVDGLIAAPLELAGFVNPDDGSAETLLFGGGLDATEDLL